MSTKRRIGFVIFLTLAAIFSGCVNSGVAVTVGGRVTGLKSPITLDYNGIQSLTILYDGEFTFLGSKLSGSTYDVTISAINAGQKCTIAGGSGVLGSDNLRSISVTCGKAITVASWNVRNFGTSKASKPSVMDVISKTMIRYDLIFVQEVSTIGGGIGTCDASNNSIVEICTLLNRLNASDRAGAGTYAVRTSPISGSTGAERYSVFFRQGIISISEAFLAAEGTFSRPPFVTRVNFDKSSFYVISIHTAPGSATAEIQALPLVANARYATDSDIIILGDFNSDGSFFNETTGWPPYFTAFSPNPAPNYTNFISDAIDTTVTLGTTFTYDRLTVSPTLVGKVQASSAGAFYYDGLTCPNNEMAGIIAAGLASTCNAASLEVSDHYPVALQLNLD